MSDEINDKDINFENPFIMKLMIKGWLIDPIEDFPNNLKGLIMTDLVFAQAEFCSNKEAFIELLDFSAGEILEKFDLKEENGKIIKKGLN